MKEMKVVIGGELFRLGFEKSESKVGFYRYDCLMNPKIHSSSIIAMRDLLRSSGIDLSEIDYFVTTGKFVSVVTELVNRLRENGFPNLKWIVFDKTLDGNQAMTKEVKTYSTEGKHYLKLRYSTSSTILKDKKVLILDDVISTGSSVDAMESILEACNVNIKGKYFIFAEGEAYKRVDIYYTGVLPIEKGD